MKCYFKKAAVLVLAVFLINTGIVYTINAQDVDSANTVELAKNLVNTGKINEAQELLLSEIKINPNNTGAYQTLAEIYISKNQLSKAKNLINKAFKLEPNNPKLYSLTADLLYKNSQYDQAEQIAKKTLALDSTDSNAYLVLAKIYFVRAEKGKYLDSDKLNSLRKESLRNFRKASKYNPTSPDIHIGLAKVYLKEGQDTKAYDELLIAEELGFTNPDIIYFIGESYYQLGKYEKAIKFLKKDGIYNSAKYNKAHFILANIYEKLGDFTSAQKEYSMTLKYKPDYIEARVRLDQLRETIANLQVSNDLLPIKNDEQKSPKSLNTLADYYLIMDKLPQARDLYLQVLQKNPNDIRARAGLCELYYSQLLLGYFNNKNYFADSVYLANDLDSVKLVIPCIKVKMAGAQGVSEPIKQELLRISGNTDQDLDSLLNASRAAFLLDNYKMSKKILNSLVLPRLSDYEKFEAAKDLFLDHNYIEAKTILLSIQRKYPDEIIASILKRIDEKFELAEKYLKEGQDLYKQKKYEQASFKYRQASLLVPMHKLAHLQYAYALYKLGNKDKAIQELEFYSYLEDIYPSEKPELKWQELEELLQSWKS